LQQHCAYLGSLGSVTTKETFLYIVMFAKAAKASIINAVDVILINDILS